MRPQCVWPCVDVVAQLLTTPTNNTRSPHHWIHLQARANCAFDVWCEGGKQFEQTAIYDEALVSRIEGFAEALDRVGSLKLEAVDAQPGESPRIRQRRIKHMLVNAMGAIFENHLQQPKQPLTYDQKLDYRIAMASLSILMCFLEHLLRVDTQQLLEDEGPTAPTARLLLECLLRPWVSRMPTDDENEGVIFTELGTTERCVMALARVLRVDPEHKFPSTALPPLRGAIMQFHAHIPGRKATEEGLMWLSFVLPLIYAQAFADLVHTQQSNLARFLAAATNTSNIEPLLNAASSAHELASTMCAFAGHPGFRCNHVIPEFCAASLRAEAHVRRVCGWLPEGSRPASVVPLLIATLAFRPQCVRRTIEEMHTLLLEEPARRDNGLGGVVVGEIVEEFLEGLANSAVSVQHERDQFVELSTIDLLHSECNVQLCVGAPPSQQIVSCDPNVLIANSPTIADRVLHAKQQDNLLLTFPRVDGDTASSLLKQTTVAGFVPPQPQVDTSLQISWAKAASELGMGLSVAEIELSLCQHHLNHDTVGVLLRHAQQSRAGESSGVLRRHCEAFVMRNCFAMVDGLLERVLLQRYCTDVTTQAVDLHRLDELCAQLSKQL